MVQFRETVVDERIRLSKSKFLSGSQCYLRLWNDFHAPHLADDASDSQREIFRSGHEVGELACKRYPSGYLIEYDHLHFNDARRETEALLGDDSIPAIFEAAFEYQDLIARADVIECLSTGGWRLIEVKSTTKCKEVHVLDVRFQLYLLRGAGLEVREAGVLTLNREYVFDGISLDLGKLFQFHDVFEQVDDLGTTISDQASEMQELVANDHAPDVEPGPHCDDPYPCPYYTHCTRDFQSLDHGIDEVPRLSDQRKDELRAIDVVEIRDIPSDFHLSKQQTIVHRAVLEDRAIIDHEKLAEFDAIERPIRHLDFETYSPAIPRFAGTRPFEKIPFLFSVHMEREELPLLHTDYLHESSDDPRAQLADQLIKAVGDRGAICAYGGFERGIVSSLIEALPDQEEALQAIKERLVDLHAILSKSYYHPDFRGSFSLKRVFPVLCPEFGYDDLDIADGLTASAEHVSALDTEDTSKQSLLFTQLREYCKRDTLATFKIRKALVKIAQTTGSE